MMDFYPTVIGSPLFNREDSRRIAQALHASLRGNTNRKTHIQRISPFLDRLTQDLRSRNLPSHPAANVHLLGIYKESKRYEEGYVFWQWLAGQDDSFVDQAVYGAAIELLAYRGKHSLQELEELYVDGLKRFPGTFAEYHLSPEAVVPDRTQPTTIPGIPMALLQGILTARMLSRDWKNAYLALDTALRLYPAHVPQRFFEIFMTERPISEAYSVFLIACRSGVLVQPGHLTALIGRLRKSMYKDSSVYDRITIIRGMANAMYAYVEAGGTIEGPHMGSFFTAWCYLLPFKPHGFEYTMDEAKMRNLIATSAHELMSILIQAGMPAHPQLFTSMINIAGRYNISELLNVALQDIETAQVDIGDVGRRVVLSAAGELRNKALIERCWSQIAERAEAEGTQLSANDWLMLAKVCRRTEYVDFFDTQLQSLRHSIDTTTESRALTELHEQEFVPKTHQFTLMSVPEFESEMIEIKKQMKNIAAVVMSGQPLDLRKTPFSMFLDPNREPVASTEDLRAVYDEFTTDPHQPPPSKDVQVAVPLSPTGIPLDELRFQNWATIVELMREAEVTEEAFQRRLDEAIANGRPLDKVPYEVSFRKPQSFSKDEDPNNKLRKPSKFRLQEIVRRLRGPYISGAPQAKPVSIRKIVAASPASDDVGMESKHITSGLKVTPKPLKNHKQLVMTEDGPVWKPVGAASPRELETDEAPRPSFAMDGILRI